MKFKQLKNLPSLKVQKWPSKSQWWQFLKAPHQILVGREKIVFSLFFFTAIISAVYLSVNFYLKNTEVVPAPGGKFTEGIVGYPRFINPIYADTSDIDRDLVELIFSGLLKYDQQGQIISDLAQDYKILEQGRVYEFTLKENAFWQDGKKITSDDVIFTIKTIQNSEIKSPLLPNWLGVEIEKIDDLTVRFKLKEPYSAFLERATVKIIPEHIWKDVLPKNFPLVLSNLQPIGSGPYQFKNLYRDGKGEISSLELTLNKKYFGEIPNIGQFSFKFFDSEEKLVEAANSEEIQGLNLSSKQTLKNQKFQDYRFVLPRYFAVFFNPKNSKALSEKEVRRAINYGTDKNELLEKILHNQGQIIDSPLLPELYKFNPASTTYEFDLEKAKEILEKAGFVEKEACPPSAGAEGDCRRGKRVKIIKKEPAFQFKSNLKQGSTGKEVEELQKCLSQDAEVYPLGKIDGNFDSTTKKAVIRFQEKYNIEKEDGKVLEKTRKKLNELCFKTEEETIPLKFALFTVEQPLLKETAILLQKQWENLGAEVEVKTLNINDLERDIIKSRNYDALLFGEVLGQIPDPFPFWHSSQREFGLNLTDYKNQKVDELLEAGRIELSPETRAQKYEEVQEIIIEDAAAVFLYNPDYIYLASKEVKRVGEGLINDTSKRFAGIENWYIKTKRRWK